MTKLKTGALLATLLIASLGHAEPLYVDWPVELSSTPSTVTRGEVLADFHLWRLSGMEAQFRSEAPPDTNSAAYRNASARYAALRNSPRFHDLARQLDGHPFSSVASKP